MAIYLVTLPVASASTQTNSVSGMLVQAASAAAAKLAASVYADANGMQASADSFGAADTQLVSGDGIWALFAPTRIFTSAQ